MAKRIHSKRTTIAHLPPALGSKGRAWSRQVTADAIKKGIIRRQPCKVCGAKRVHAHHTNYSKPLEVEWLCHQHHVEAHGNRWRPEKRAQAGRIKIMLTIHPDFIAAIDEAAAGCSMKRAAWASQVLVRACIMPHFSTLGRLFGLPTALQAAQSQPSPVAPKPAPAAIPIGNPGQDNRPPRIALTRSFDPDSPT